MKDIKKNKLSKEDIISKLRRWVTTKSITPSDVEDFIKENDKKPMSSDSFNDLLKDRIRKRHLESSVHLQNLGQNWEEDFNHLSQKLKGYTERLELLRSGSESFGENPVTHPLSKKDVAYSIKFWEQNYQKIETGRNQITIDLLIRLVAFYKVSADIILFGFHPFKKVEENNSSLSQEKTKDESEIIKEKDRVIKDLRETVDLYREKVRKLEEELNN